MKVVLVSTSDLVGGACRGTYRLHTGLRRIGIDSEMLVRYKTSDDPFVVSLASTLTGKVRFGAAAHLDRVPLSFYRGREPSWSLQWVPTGIQKDVRARRPDVVHLNWIGGLVAISALAKLPLPVLWTLADMWAFTGGCYYDQGCGRFQTTCGNCPQLASTHERDLSRWGLTKKQRAWERLPIVVIAISRWLGEAARRSPVFASKRVEVIPYGLDTETFRPIVKEVARDLLHLPRDRKVVLFGADGGAKTPRKGALQLREALHRLHESSNRQHMEVVIFGESEPLQATDWGFPARYLGRIHDDLTLALAYSAADVMLVPSIQEAFGQTASEALACGTPVVAFDATGLRDIVDHKANGYLARPFDPEDLARGIEWVLDDEDRARTLSANARQKAEVEYTLELQARRYKKLYEDELSRRSPS